LRRRAASRFEGFYATFFLLDRNFTPNAIAFCATAPGVRRSFFAVATPDSFAFAKARRFFTSSFDHATNLRFFTVAIEYLLAKRVHMIPTSLRK
jgi:hypothetical protein